MVAVDRLEQYDEAERQLARERAPLAAPNGFIADMAPVFDHDSSDRIAVMRAGAPLSALIIFYRQTVVFVPPASVANLERRFAMTWDALLTLIDAGIVLPVVGNPVEYANKRHFGDLFDYRPPSVWSRGDELARRFAGGDGYWEEARSILPLDEIAASRALRRKWRQHRPGISADALSELVKHEVCTNFVDLCVFGYAPLARDTVKSAPAELAAIQLLDLCELLVYPTLFAGHGIANFGADRGPRLDRKRLALVDAGRTSEVPRTASILASTLGLEFPANASVEAIQEIHRSELGPALWSAAGSLDDLVSGGDERTEHERAIAAELEIASALREIRLAAFTRDRLGRRRRIERTFDAATKLTTAAAIAAAAYGAGLDGITSAATGASLVGFLSVIEAPSEWIRRYGSTMADRVVRRDASPLAQQLWWTGGKSREASE